MTPEKKPLTGCQARVYRAILSHWSEHAVPPTIRELMAACDIHSPNGVVCNMKALRKKGWIVTGRNDLSRAAIPVDLNETVKALASMLLQSEPESRAA
jgi:SOS-response transcriptional repressor LexA